MKTKNTKQITKEAIIEALKEPLRLLVLAIIPFGVVYLTQIDTQWAIYAVLVLKFIDKALHNIGKDTESKGEESLLTLGLTRF